MSKLLVICAHNDDQVIGAGGTLAKYAAHNWTVKTIFFSAGEMSHPHLKKKEIVKTRMEEVEKSDEILGLHGFTCLHVEDQNFKKSIVQKKAKQKLRKYIQDLRPDLVFTHSKDDVHPDHRAVYQMVRELIEEKILACPVYSFDVWTPFGIAQAKAPRLYVDISDTLSQKVQAFLAHRSQMVTVFQLIWSVYLRAFLNGRRNKTKYAEVFYRVL